MKEARAWPYLRAADKRIKSSGWMIKLGDKERELGETLKDWDPSTNLMLKRPLRIDVPAIYEDCRLPPEARVRLLVSWHCDGTTLRGVGDRIDLSPHDKQSFTLGMQINAQQISSSLKLQTTLVLANELPPRPIVAFRPGTTLWEDKHELLLEGEGSRFPMHVTSFKEAHLPTKAAWTLEWDLEDLELPVLGSLQLLLNEDHPKIKQLISVPDEPTSHLMMALIQFDVARQMIRTSLENSDFVMAYDEGNYWPKGSVGATVHALMKTFSRDSAASLRQMMRHEPTRFETALQHHIGILREV